MEDKVKMGVFKDGEVKDFGYYESVEKALGDLINYDFPHEIEYALIECEEFTGRVDTIEEAEELLEKFKKVKR